MKTSELTGQALDYAVAEIESQRSGVDWTDWSPDYSGGSYGDGVIDRERIGTLPQFDGTWLACLLSKDGNRTPSMYGATRREAAMRAYVAAKRGSEVEIPEGLL
jgi:hypothetical protein